MDGGKKVIMDEIADKQYADKLQAERDSKAWPKEWDTAFDPYNLKSFNKMKKSLLDGLLENPLNMFDQKFLQQIESLKQPAVNNYNNNRAKVQVNDTTLRLEIELAGFKKEDIRVQYSNSQLSVDATKDLVLLTEGKTDRQKAPWLFKHSLSLPSDVWDVKNLKVTFQNGLLVIEAKKINQTSVNHFYIEVKE